MDNGIKSIYEKLKECNFAVSTDTRQIIQSSLFFALPGPRFDGNDFARQALAAGASYCVVTDPDLIQDERMLLVNDSLLTLQQLAAYHRHLMRAKVVAITGSNGKTTTKELLYSIMSRVRPTVATLGNLNNHIGLPLTLLRISEETEFAIVEMGANHMGEIAGLCTIASPDIGLITSIGKAHLEGFGNFESVILAKKELFDYLDDHNAYSFYNLEQATFRQLYSQSAKHIPLGTEFPIGRYRVVVNEFHDKIILELISLEGVIVRINSELYGLHNVENIINAAGLAHFLGASVNQIAEGISEYVPMNQRSQIINYRGNKIYMDAYNANPSSMEIALENFRQMVHPKKWLILGSMAELGKYSTEEHKKVLEMALECNPETIILVGSGYDAIKETLQHVVKCSDVGEAKDWLDRYLHEGACILIKGSRSNALEKLID